MKILDLGCGNNKKGTIGIDIRKDSNADIIHNLNEYPYPFKDDEFDMIIADHILEHLDDYKKTMEELHRITKNKGKIIIRVPHFSSTNAYSRIGHRWYLGCNIFKEFPNFKVLKIRLNYTLTNIKQPLWKKTISYIPNLLANLNIWFCERVWCYMVGGFAEIYAELKVVKLKKKS